MVKQCRFKLRSNYIPSINVQLKIVLSPEKNSPAILLLHCTAVLVLSVSKALFILCVLNCVISNITLKLKKWVIPIIFIIYLYLCIVTIDVELLFFFRCNRCWLEVLNASLDNGSCCSYKTPTIDEKNCYVNYTNNTFYIYWGYVNFQCVYCDTLVFIRQKRANHIKIFYIKRICFLNRLE